MALIMGVAYTAGSLGCEYIHAALILFTDDYNQKKRIHDLMCLPKWL